MRLSGARLTFAVISSMNWRSTTRLESKEAELIISRGIPVAFMRRLNSLTKGRFTRPPINRIEPSLTAKDLHLFRRIVQTAGIDSSEGIESNQVLFRWRINGPMRRSKLLKRDRAGIFQSVLAFWAEQFCDEMVIVFRSVLSRKWKNKKRVYESRSISMAVARLVNGWEIRTKISRWEFGRRTMEPRSSAQRLQPATHSATL
jgi:hypothetical protein